MRRVVSCSAEGQEQTVGYWRDGVVAVLSAGVSECGGFLELRAVFVLLIGAV